ncbi:hypothetical protein Tco_0508170 [Tanacetum coccineum]
MPPDPAFQDPYFTKPHFADPQFADSYYADTTGSASVDPGFASVDPGSASADPRSAATNDPRSAASDVHTFTGLLQSVEQQETDIQEKDEKQSQKRQNQARNGKDKVKSKPKGVRKAIGRDTLINISIPREEEYVSSELEVRNGSRKPLIVRRGCRGGVYHLADGDNAT